MKLPFLLPLLLTIACAPEKPTEPSLKKLETPTKTLLQAISQVDEQTVWISGHQASFIRSTDAGETWDLFQHPTGDTLQFRDIHGFDGEKAILMSAGPGSLSRIFTFENEIWEENFVMQDSLGFLDCIDFWDEQNGIAYGDAIDEYPYILLTSDGGKSWDRAPTKKLPKAGKGEGGFAASGTCVTTGAHGSAWIATGAGGNCRVLLTKDYGQTWIEVASPLVKGEAAGNTSVSFNGEIGMLVGGDLAQPNEFTRNTAFSINGGSTWKLGQQPKTIGPLYGGAITLSENEVIAFACGPKGLDYSPNLGETWQNLDTLNYWAVSFYKQIGFASGRGGEVLKISLEK